MASFKKKKFDNDELEMDLKSTSSSQTKEKKKKEKEKIETVGLIELFKFSDSVDKIFIFLGIVNAIICGAVFPLMFYIFGDLTDIFSQFDNPLTQLSDERLMESVLGVVWKMCSIGGAMWVSHYVFVACLNYAAERQVLRIRKEFFKAVLRQDLAWYDTTTTSEFATRMTEDLNKMQDGIGEKVGMLIRFIVTGLGSFIIPYIQNWRISLVLTAIVPVMAIMGGVMGKIMAAASKGEMDTYGKAGAIAEEVLSSIRTVVAFGGQKKELENYSLALKEAKKHSIIKGTLTLSTIGLMFGLIYAAYGLAFWYGCKLVMDYREKPEYMECLAQCLVPDENGEIGGLDCFLNCDRFTVGSVTTAIFGILNGGMQIGQSSMYVEAVATAKAAAVQIFHVIDRVPLIDSMSEAGTTPKVCEGNISFKKIVFHYPSRKDVKILDDFSLDIERGSTVALVGSSGCGKSTCVQLLQRLYDPDTGDIWLDGQNLRDLNVGWLRDNIGIVGQEPVLFDCSIKENIKYAKQDATEKEIEEACREANAFEFISKLPKGLDTMVGEGGAQLSGGQKQRIAIARALIRNPKILLLDEATSALDNESEAIVQAALDRLHSGRTTLVIAHRLSTVRNADKIVAMEAGAVKEVGTHAELMAKEGLYFSLVNRQMAGKDQQPEDGEEEEVLENGFVSPKKEKIFSKQVSKQVSIKENKSEVQKSVSRQSRGTLIRRLMAKNKPEWLYIIVGCIFSMVFGALTPLFGSLFGDVMGVFYNPIPADARKEMQKYALYFGGLGGGFLISNIITGFTFSLSGARLVERIRREMFASMLSQEVGWFDQEENNTGALCARLSTSAEAVSSATGGKIGQVVSGVSILVLSSVLSIIYEWRLGLVTMCFLPPMIIGMVFQLWLMMFDGAVQRDALEKSAKVAVEAINNIRTVSGLRCESHLYGLYCEELQHPHRLAKRKAHMRGLVYGFANSNFMFAYSVCYYYGAWLIINDPDSGLKTDTIWKVAIMVLNGGAMIGMSLTALMDVNNAFTAAEKIFEVLDRKPKVDCNPSTGLQLNGISGAANIEQGVFSYPTRRDIKILRQLNLAINKGEKVALVGQSGCGKSTVIQMIQRFYDFDEGSMNIDGKDIRNLNLPFVRSKLGIVSQEPVLFNKTIAENIKYGDNDRDISMEEVIEAARKANIHSFVSSLPEGYETNVGGKGTQLSGGQKQRVAIARALIRNPSIILLDEATSALDTESEKIVQEALETAQVGRTSITIAHRLSTIMDSDRIFVLERGQVAECGTHSELLARKGIYHNLWSKSVEAV